MGEQTEVQRMRRYRVSVTRIAYALHEIEVDARSEEEARAKAQGDAGDHEYREHAAEYEVAGVEVRD